jgi:acyl-CoA reductase-like NAD-dependent aldehyde dehydrogenase
VDKLHSLVADATSKVCMTPQQLSFASADISLFAESQGANLIKGVAITPKDDEISHAPVILDRVDSSQDIYHQETFGPSLVVIRAKDVEDAIRIANDSDVGLSASVWGKDYKQCLDVAKRIESGAVHINSMTVHDEPNLPHGGMKVSRYVDAVRDSISR